MDRLRRRQVFGPDGYPVAGAVIALDAPVETHTHDFLELAVLVAGRVTYVSDTGRYPLEAGAVMAVRPGDWHGYADQHDAVIANLYLGEELLHTELRWLLDVGDLGRFLLRGGLAGRAARLPRPGRGPVPDHRAGGGACRAGPSERRPGGRTVPVRPWPSSVACGWTTTGDPRSVPPCGSCCSWSAVDRPIRGRWPSSPGRSGCRSPTCTGSSAASWASPRWPGWRSTRAEVAASLLLQTDRPVGWVGAQVGWSDPNYFSRCFRRAYGISPSTYRQRNTTPLTHSSEP